MTASINHIAEASSTIHLTAISISYVFKLDLPLYLTIGIRAQQLTSTPKSERPNKRHVTKLSNSCPSTLDDEMLHALVFIRSNYRYLIEVTSNISSDSWAKTYITILPNSCPSDRSSHPEVFLGKAVLKICSKFSWEHPCQNVILIKLLCNFIEITLRHGCSPVTLMHIFRTPFPQNTSEWLLLFRVKWWDTHFVFWNLAKSRTSSIMESICLLIWSVWVRHSERTFSAFHVYTVILKNEP